jgi:hypothetical protein
MQLGYTTACAHLAVARARPGRPQELSSFAEAGLLPVRCRL